MIKKIYLHIGDYKTASTSIQKIFGKKRETLRKHGYLYPQFRIGDKIVYNHSNAFLSLFTKDPIKCLINIRNGYTDSQRINELHKQLKKQIRDEIAGFEGENLIISGEHFSNFDCDQIARFKQYLIRLTNNQVEFKLFLFCRHPVTRTESRIQQNIKEGYLTLDKAEEEHERISRNYYKTIIARYSGIFSFENIHVIRFEDAIKHPIGPAGALISMISGDDLMLNKPDDIAYNTTVSYEALAILSSINKKIPAIIDHKKNPRRKNFRSGYIKNIPGISFRLSAELRKKIWNDFKEDINWLCDTFSLPKYEFEEVKFIEEEKVWSSDVLNAINRALTEQNRRFRFLILNAIADEIENYNFYISDEKKEELRQFVSKNQNKLVQIKHDCLFYIYRLVRLPSYLKKRLIK